MSERNYWLGFSNFQGIGPARFSKLLKHFGSAKNAWEAPGSPLGKLLGEKMAGEFDRFRNEFPIEDYVGKLEEKKVWFVTLEDKEYPELLREIKNPPFVLYGKGDKELLTHTCSTHSFNDSSEPSGNTQQFFENGASTTAGKFENDKSRKTVKSAFREEPHAFSVCSSENELSRPTIAVVGTRKTTQYGREVTKLLAEELVLNGFTIVSGLALGIDAISHMVALENNGRTIAVLGCGVDCCSPRENYGLYNSIVKSGNCIVSEYPLGMKPTQWTFPARNRIIAGLSMAVLVTEGAEDSGALITAAYALKFNRKVFAVPGPITSTMSRGPYKLIQKGAKLVTNGQDILKELSITSTTSITGIKGRKGVKGETKEENLILKILENEPLHFDEIVRKTGLPSSKAGSILSLMEVKGMVKSLEGGVFST